MIKIDECIVEKIHCEASCTNRLTKSDISYKIYTNTSSFVGVNAYLDPICTCSSALAPHSCDPNPCLNQGICHSGPTIQGFKLVYIFISIYHSLIHFNFTFTFAFPDVTALKVSTDHDVNKRQYRLKELGMHGIIHFQCVTIPVYKYILPRQLKTALYFTTVHFLELLLMLPVTNV